MRIARSAVTGVLLALLAVATAHAQTGDGYDARWKTVDTGGGQAGAAGFRLSGTLGQPDAAAVAAGEYDVHGGFWRGAVALQRPAYAGDANCDERLSAADIVALLRLIPLHDPGPCGRADVNLDHSVDESDLPVLIELLFLGSAP